MVSATRTIGLAALFAAAPGSAWAEGASPQGSYQASAQGRVALSTERGQLSARMLDGGACGFERGRQAVRLGFGVPSGTFLDTELDRFLGSEGEYLGLANLAVENYKAAARRQPAGP